LPFSPKIESSCRSSQVRSSTAYRLWWSNEFMPRASNDRKSATASETVLRIYNTLWLPFAAARARDAACSNGSTTTSTVRPDAWGSSWVTTSASDDRIRDGYRLVD
jgi:hypothetical protein